MLFSKALDAIMDKSVPATALPVMRSAASPRSRPRDVVQSPAMVAGRSRTASSLVDGALVITGNVTARGKVQVEGEVRGDVRCSSLVVGEHATINGDIVADDVTIGGRVVGSVRARCVTLQATSRVEGDIHHQSLAIRQGAVFDGKARRCDDPMADISCDATIAGSLHALQFGVCAELPPHL